MKISLAQLDPIIGDFKTNSLKIKKCINDAIEQGADLICFPELATCGYPPQDLLLFNDFLKGSNDLIQSLLPLSQKIGIIIGAPLINNHSTGKPLFNAAFFLHQGSIQKIIKKTLLPTYDIFDENRYFEPNDNWELISFKNKKIALTICEDIWNIGPQQPLYKTTPMDQLNLLDPDLMINISASPFSKDHHLERLAVLQANSRKYQIPIFYVNQVGAQTDILFDGGSCVLDENGELIADFPAFEEAVKTFDKAVLDQSNKIFPEGLNHMAFLEKALINGIKGFFGKLNIKTAVLGLSGGIDSAVTAVLAVKALGAQNVRALLMPSKYSSHHSVDDAVALAQNLSISYDVLPIRDLVTAYDQNLAELFANTTFSLAEENIQARIRGNLLMAISNKFGNLLLNTSNKSELAVGYGTLYGDLCGGLSVLGDVYKTEVYRLAKWMNRHEEIIPDHTITKPPSAELRPDQKDSDSLPPYEILDQILFHFIEKEQSTSEIIAQGFDRETVNQIIGLVNRNEFKRYQTAPILRVTKKSFGSGRRLPIVAKYTN